ncbi:transcription cofactor vestigial-like protein 4 isoform X1 [Zootermopsis nevadensis]|uniref:transcription cofactor vestigial-like protein 4 isoform X1 n=1 Tax=Zootermopsis nevadensis TaxID=136037 RepID=UPI000B8E21D6|nr:transcription cofactor vestigial-like protein 4 isoform X1 [Zootermopsis nevadensis]
MMEATESPLDVLSRAATMVQDSSPPDYGDERNCSTKELPTTRWRRERRCRDKLGDYTKSQQTKATHGILPYDTPAGPPLPDALGTHTHTSITGDTPLDMTMTRGSKPPPSYSQSVANCRNGPARPSVITCAPPAATLWGGRSPDDKGTNKDENGRQGHRRELLSGMCDPVIDEHFRRSLGKDYMSLFSSDSTTTNNNNNSNSSNGNSSITVTGLSVDDHFAKALGETWVKLQGQTSKSTSSSTLITKEKKPSAPSTATVSVSVAKETTPSSAPAPAASLLQQRRGLVSI